MKIALFGGSFNPPHIAHQLICLYLIEYKKFDKVWVIPCYRHAFEDKHPIEFNHRHEMCQLMTAPLGSKVTVSGVEQLLYGVHGKNYTIDTIRDFKSRWPNDDFTLIIGADIIEDLNRWKEFHEIRKLVDILVHSRNGYIEANSTIWRFDVANFVGPEVSSTDIRQRINRGESIEGLVSTSIQEYIKKNRLYIS
jgi:nicotinate-nucleotide adenylyltransferase